LNFLDKLLGKMLSAGFVKPEDAFQPESNVLERWAYLV